MVYVTCDTSYKYLSTSSPLHFSPGPLIFTSLERGNTQKVFHLPFKAPMVPPRSSPLFIPSIQSMSAPGTSICAFRKGSLRASNRQLHGRSKGLSQQFAPEHNKEGEETIKLCGRNYHVIFLEIAYGVQNCCTFLPCVSHQ